MSGFRWGEPYRNPEGSTALAWEQAHEAIRGLGLRVLVVFRRQCRRVGMFRVESDGPMGDGTETNC